MEPERWQRTEALYHAAAARPPGERAAFLADACGDDDAVRREVQSLLKEAEAGDGFLTDGVVELAPADIPFVAASAAMSGRSLGPYRLTSLLGAGGMGEVYRAHDATLGRDVAIKILPAAFTSNADRLARFEREARMLAALNHPNICGIYGVEHAGDIRFLILEFVDGKTLAEKLVQRSDCRSPGLQLSMALTLARQIAEALEAAHDKGIIHRDLKPANIKITTQGVAKVLDFGLAKNVAPDDSTPDLTYVPPGPNHDRRYGVVIGTAAYMSPEQARGAALDKRTDIWAFGCVLYEMLSGRMAFGAATVSDTIAKILEREPDWSALPPATPGAIRRLLERCLAKDQKQRLRDIGEVRIALADVPSTASSTSAPRRHRGLPFTWAPWVVVAALAVVLGARETARTAISFSDRIARAQFTPITSWGGAEEAAAISPDGKFVAFLSDQAGEFDLWLSQVGTGRFSNLTRDFPGLAGGGAIVRKLGFSGHGAEIWFNPGDRKQLRLLPLTGGASRPILPEGTNTPAWSPDGTRVVFFGKPPDGADPMFIADHTGADPRQLLTPSAGMKRNNPEWSADGEWIYFVSGSEPQDEMDMNIWRARVSDGFAEQLTHQHGAVNFLAPVDARTLLYVARADNGSGPWLWALDLPTKAAHRVPAGVDQFTSVASSLDGHRIVVTMANPTADLWRVPLLDRTAGNDDVEPYPLPVPTGRVHAPRFGGTAMFYLAARGTSDGLWKVQGDSVSEVWRDADGALFEPPAVSPDGSRVAVVVRRAGKRHLIILAADGTNQRTLAPSIEIEGAAGQSAASWSPDGTWIVAGGRTAEGPALFKIPVDRGEPERLVDGKWVNPVWSPDGKLIVYAGRSLIGLVTVLGVRPDGTPVNLPELRSRPGGYRFLPDGSGLVYLPGIHARDFWLLNFASGTRPLTALANHGLLRNFDITPDGKYIVFDRSRENSDVVLIDLPPR